MGRNARDCLLDLHWADSRVRLDGLLLDGRDPAGLFTPHAVPGEQPDTPQPRRGRRFQHECLVAWAVPIDGVGRELAPESSHARGIPPPWPTPVSDRYPLVFHLHARNPP